MLFYLFLTLYVIVCLLLLVVVLLQQGKGGDIAAAFGGSSSQAAFGARAGATVLTRATTILGALFMLGSLGLAVTSSEGGFSRSVVGGIDGPPPAAAPAQPAGGGGLTNPTTLPNAPTTPAATPQGQGSGTPDPAATTPAATPAPATTTPPAGGRGSGGQ